VLAELAKGEKKGMNFHALFEPQSLAVIGVSLTNDRHPANVIYNKNRLRYPFTTLFFSHRL
jgi:hypothetical protein